MSASPQVFLSYSREDQSAARRVAQALEAEGFSVWWDQTLHSGDNYDQVTEQALREAKAVVVLWSKTSVESRWVRAEATQADRLGTLVPAMIEECMRPIMFELKHTAELVHWKGDTQDAAWRAYVEDLHRMCGARQASEQAAAPVAARGHSGALRWSLTGVAALAVAGLAGWFWMQSAGASRARTEIIPEVARLVDTGDVRKAFDLAQQARRYAADDPLLNSLTPLFATKYEINTTPAGADVYVRDYEDGPEQLRYLGQTPVAVELPRRVYYWKFSKEGYATIEHATSVWAWAQAGAGVGVVEQQVSSIEIPLRAVSEQPADMVHVPEGTPRILDEGVPQLRVPEFFMDRHEVTNAQYKEFIDAGGYERVSLWADMPLGRNGVPGTFEQAMQLFLDKTDRPGPRAWELGGYPDGEADFPVSGISWYEAAAYARFRSKSLPSYYHWLRAAEGGDGSLVASVPPRSNLGGSGPAQVGTFPGVGPYGTYDLFGNEREWLANHGSTRGWLIGGGWGDPVYLYGIASPVSLLERSERNGFRLVQDIDVDAPLEAMRSEEALGKTRRAVSAAPVSDAIYAEYVRQLEYHSGPVNATEPVTLSETGDWIKQRVTIDAGYNSERMDVLLFIPKRSRPPFQPVILFPGAGAFLGPGKGDDREPGGSAALDAIVKTGRVLVMPAFQGSFERFKKSYDGHDVSRTGREWWERRSDLGRTIDYLETRADIDAGRVGFVGASFGASVAIPIVAVEKRIKAVVLQSGGLPPANYGPAVTDVAFLDVASHGARIKVPVLMINGSYDYIFPVETAQKPFYELLGTPPADKRYVREDFDHGSPPRALSLKETLAWFDKYLGPVRQ